MTRSTKIICKPTTRCLKLSVSLTRWAWQRSSKTQVVSRTSKERSSGNNFLLRGMWLTCRLFIMTQSSCSRGLTTSLKSQTKLDSTEVRLASWRKWWKANCIRWFCLANLSCRSTNPLLIMKRITSQKIQRIHTDVKEVCRFRRGQNCGFSWRSVNCKGSEAWRKRRLSRDAPSSQI